MNACKPIPVLADPTISLSGAPLETTRIETVDLFPTAWETKKAEPEIGRGVANACPGLALAGTVCCPANRLRIDDPIVAGDDPH